VFLTALFVVLDSPGGGFAGLVITYVLQATGLLQVGQRVPIHAFCYENATTTMPLG
jgi:hypothetical protein